jgi:hypothetical protein
MLAQITAASLLSTFCFTHSDSHCQIAHENTEQRWAEGDTFEMPRSHFQGIGRDMGQQ